MISDRGSDVLGVLSLGQRAISSETELEVVDMRLFATFEGASHGRRIRQIK